MLAIDGSPAYDWVMYATLSGWFTFLDADELHVWESRVTASTRIPAGMAVTTTDRVRVTVSDALMADRFHAVAVHEACHAVARWCLGYRIVIGVSRQAIVLGDGSLSGSEHALGWSKTAPGRRRASSVP